MAATLMYIKSRELLPVDQQVQVEEEEDPIDPRWDLIRQLVEYKKFKDMAAQLQGREAQMDAVYGRQPGKVELPQPEETEVGKGVSLFDLIQAVSTILKRFQETEKPGTIAEDKWSVSEKIQLIDEMIQTRSVVRFSELFAAARTRAEVIVTFLAMLELTRMKKAWLAQPEVFGEIEVSAAPPEAALPGGPVEPPEAETAALPRQQLADADEEFDEAAFLEAQAKLAAAKAAATAPAESTEASEPAASTEAEATSEEPATATEAEGTRVSSDDAEATSEPESLESSEAGEVSEENEDADEDADEYDEEDDEDEEDDDETEEASSDEDEFDEDEDDEDEDDEDEFDEADLDGEASAEDEAAEAATEIAPISETPDGEAQPAAPAAATETAEAKPESPGNTAPPAGEAPAAPAQPA